MIAVRLIKNLLMGGRDMGEYTVMSYIGYILIYVFVFVLSFIGFRATSSSLKNSKSKKGMYRVKWYNLLSKFAMFASVFIILSCLISILQLVIK